MTIGDGLIFLSLAVSTLQTFAMFMIFFFYVLLYCPHSIIPGSVPVTIILDFFVYIIKGRYLNLLFIFLKKANKPI